MLITSYDVESWNSFLEKEKLHEILENLEKGKIIYLPKLTFFIKPEYRHFLNPSCLAKGTKNISFNPETADLKGFNQNRQDLRKLKQLMSRFSAKSAQLISTLFPHYQKVLRIGRTSFRPAEIEGRQTSYRKDDTRLHIDAFPSTPMHGKRILRVFCNINPNNQPRQWHLGESFDQVMNRFAPVIRKPFPGAHILLNSLGITKNKRSLYDHYMLKIHNIMKSDEDYQKKAIQEKIAFPANTAWIVFTDLVSHAALSGQHLLEQTFYLHPKNQLHPEWSPLKKLEAYFQRDLLNTLSYPKQKIDWAEESEAQQNQ